MDYNHEQQHHQWSQVNMQNGIEVEPEAEFLLAQTGDSTNFLLSLVKWLHLVKWHQDAVTTVANLFKSTLLTHPQQLSDVNTVAGLGNMTELEIYD